MVATIFGRPFLKRFALLCYQTVLCPVCPVSLRRWCTVAKGWMDQDETWHACRPRPWPHCVRWWPSSPSPKGAQPPIFGAYLLWPNGWMDGLRCHFVWRYASARPRPLCVRWGPSSPSPKRGRPQTPNFRPMSIVAKRLGGSRWHLAWMWASAQATLC